MLAKLMKYDLKWTYKLLLIFYALSVVFSLLTRLFLSFDDSLLLHIVGAVMRGCAIAMMINSIINAVMRSWVRFTRSIYGDESYLTHTLPVPRGTVYLSKLLSAVISIFTSVLLTLLCVLICFYSEDMVELVKSAFSNAAAAYDTSVAALIAAVSAVLFFQLVFILMSGYVGVIIGHRCSGGKMGMSVLAGFGIYAVMSGLLLAVVFVIGAFNEDVMSMITTSSAVSIGAVKLLMTIVIVVYALYDLALCAAGGALLKKSVNVD